VKTVFLKAIGSAVRLLLSGNPEIYQIIGRSLFVSVTAVVLAGVAGIPLGFLLGLRKFPGKALTVKVLYVLMGLPPVFVGLIVFILLSRNGPIGRYYYLLFTPAAMIVAQVLLALPIIAGLTMSAVEERAPWVLETAKGLGADKWRANLTLLTELRIPMIVGIVTAFGRVSAEVGAVMLVGGDIAGYTRVLTTAIVLETRMGHFELAIALGLVLLSLSFLINSLLYQWQYKR